ncbi:fengycin family lipopeptide synthetase B [Clostridium cavendishii DSM 21758]|uniref:Fengycin family lipopeptide synthetase B n=1 Tax=Clostridium cavendishii DSM 21758 TaxID=1121302 RepID=A0A1M6MTA0_9CLOT|nr:non-ribosomal peptide synthetase [Clostridium cavendishii]SHJ86642.1 fengycin family lipopeptide synthetase B [Clostridium cavendishii DSM 21758]
MVKIQKSAIKNIYPLTFVQEGMLFHSLNNLDNKDLYFEQLLVEIDGEIDKHIFEKAWTEVVTRNEALRTIFRWEKISKPLQIILKEVIPSIFHYDFSELGEKEKEEAIVNIKIKDKILGFKLEEEVPFRITLCKKYSNQYLVILSSHHILFDGWSNGIIMKQFLRLYDSISNNYSIENTINFANIFGSFAQQIRSQDKAPHTEYWRNYLSGINQPTYLGMIQNDNIIKDVGSTNFYLPKELCQNIYGYLESKNTTIAAFFYMIWGLLLQDYLDTNDVVFGTTISGRNVSLPGILETVGMFINTIPLRVKTSNMDTPDKVLGKIGEDICERIPYESASLVDIQKLTDISGRNSIFNTIFVVEDYPIESMSEFSLKIKDVSINEMNNYDLTVTLYHDKNEYIHISINYDTEKFMQEYIDGIYKHLINIIQSTLSNPHINLDKMKYMNDEKIISLQENSLQNSYEGFIKLFEEHVNRNSNRVAISCGNQKTTYAILNEKAEHVKNFLNKVGYKSNHIVALHLKRSVNLFAAMIGIWKVGGTFELVDYNFPKRYSDNLIKDKNFVITEDKNLSGQNIIEINKIFENEIEWESYCVKNSHIVNGKNQSVYEKNIEMYMNSVYLQKMFPICEEDIIYQCTPYNCFDSAWELIWCLSNGAMFCYPENCSDVDMIVNDLIDCKVTVLRTIPSLLDSILILIEEDYDISEFGQLKYTFTDEIPLKQSLVQLFKDVISCETCCELIGLYRYLEFDFYTFVYNYTRNDERGINNLIGKPIDENYFCLLDRYGREQIIGGIGEICVLRPNDTTQKNWIRTGEYGIWNTNGFLQLVHTSSKVKRLDGYNIYAEVIDSYVTKFEGINDSLTCIQKYEEKEYVYTYFTADKEIYINSLRNYLKDNMPYYLVPLYFIQVKDMSEVRKKINNKAYIGDNKIFEVEVVEVAPKNEIERKIWEIWGKILDKKVGIHHDFFDVGGDSLNILQVNSQLAKEFNIKIPLSEMFQHPTISALSQYIQKKLDISNRDFDVEPIKKEIAFYALSKNKNLENQQDNTDYSVSYAQSQLLLHSEVNGSGVVYNMPLAIKIIGELDSEKLKSAFNKLVQRHEALRTSFKAVNGTYVQNIHEFGELTILEEKVDAKDLDIKISSFIQSFDLSKAPLLRVKLLNVNNDEYHIMLIDMHHTISDGLSYKILLNEFNKIYNGQVLPNIEVQYKDFAIWQRHSVESGELFLQEQYWLERFKNGVPAMSFPMDFKRPKSLGANVKKVSHIIEKDDVELIVQFLRKTKTTMYMFMLASFHVMLSKYSLESEVITGTPVAGRRHPDLEKVIGNFVNMVPIWTTVNPRMSFTSYLYEVKDITIEAFNNQDYPFEVLAEKLSNYREMWKNPIFDFVLTFLNNDFSVNELPGNEHYIYELNRLMAKYDLLMTISERNQTLIIDWEYRTDLFEHSTIEELANRYVRLVKNIIKNPEVMIENIDILSEKETSFLLSENNNSSIKYPIDKTIHQLFEEQVKKSPNKIAIICGEEQWSYLELNEYSSKIATLLKRKGLEKEDIVGIHFNRSIKMIAGILGILKAGGAYMPIDPEYPDERKKFMLDDSGARILLTETELLTFNIDETNLCIICIDKEKLDDQECIYSSDEVSPNQIAYIIYTSGSLGLPKGVVIEHKNVVRLMKNDNMIFDFNESDIWSVFHSFCFDFSVWELYGALLYGGTAVVISRETARDPEEFWRLLKKEKITVLNQTPGSFRNMLIEQEAVDINDHNLRYVIFGGEELQPAMLKEWHSKNQNVSLINMYGITETTVHVTYKKITDKEIDNNQSNIGKPISTLSTYLMDENKKLVPLGSIGEIYVGGEGVARGYLNQPELTKERFVYNPYNPEERLYKTGDYAKQLRNGELVYCGRKDNQVKVRGHRIELNEIETILLQNKKVKEVVVLGIKDASDKISIIAFIVVREKMDVQEIRNYLAEKLPYYMIPSQFMFVDKIPLTLNGKIDKNELESMVKGFYNKKIEVIETKNDNEAEMCNIWEQVLNTSQIDIEDNFFEIGGDSATLVKLRTLIENRWQIKVQVVELFSHPTVSSMVSLVESKILN